MSIEITIDFIEDLRKSRELFTFLDLKPFEITFKLPIICTESIEYKFYESPRMLVDLVSITKKFNMIAIGNNITRSNMELTSCDVIKIIANEQNLIAAIEFLETKYKTVKIYAIKSGILAILKNIQFCFILTHYDSIIDALNDQIIGSEMVAFDGDQLLYNAEGKFAFETGYNIVNIKKCYASYKNDLNSSFYRCFGILHTDLVENHNFNLNGDDNEDNYLDYVYEGLNIFNLDKLLKNNDKFIMLTSANEIKTGIVQLRFADNMFGNLSELNLKLLYKYFTKEEIKQFIDDEKISLAKYNSLCMGKIIKIEFSDKINRIYITPEEFYGPDYIYFGQSIKGASARI